MGKLYGFERLPKTPEICRRRDAHPNCVKGAKVIFPSQRPIHFVHWAVSQTATHFEIQTSFDPPLSMRSGYITQIRSENTLPFSLLILQTGGNTKKTDLCIFSLPLEKNGYWNQEMGVHYLLLIA